MRTSRPINNNIFKLANSDENIDPVSLEELLVVSKHLKISKTLAQMELIHSYS
jgi:hypothetical protein